MTDRVDAKSIGTEASLSRVERDSMGELRVPNDALWGAQTQRAILNFKLSGLPLPRAMIRSLGYIKSAAAHANAELGLLPQGIATAIQQAAREVTEGSLDSQFPVDVFQTGSGTSSNMNANEVIAHRAAAISKLAIHPNDHVNMSQSSNDVFPSAIHVSAALLLAESLIPALVHLAGALKRKADQHQSTVITGRTHLMDAMPMTLGQEIGGWTKQIELGIDRLHSTMPRITRLALGGTAVGTGINAHPQFAALAINQLNELTGLSFAPSENYFESLSTQDAAVELSGQLKTIAAGLIKICNDLRWMNSGPLAGLSEIALPALQPGSSIMPGKVNPVIPEAVAMIGAQVIGNDAAITIGGQSGNFQLNVMLPMIANNLVQSLELLSNGARALADHVIEGFTVNSERIAASVDRNPILVTALNPVIGYEKAAAIAKRAYKEGRPILDVAVEMTKMDRIELQRLLDPKELVQGGIKSGVSGGG